MRTRRTPGAGEGAVAEAVASLLAFRQSAGRSTPTQDVVAFPDAADGQLGRRCRESLGARELVHSLTAHAEQLGADLRRDQFYDSAWKPALLGASICEQCRAEDRSRPSQDDGCTCRPLTFVFHSLRHWCASTLLAGGASLTAVAGHLGDTVETVAQVYVHWLRDDRSVPAKVLDRVVPVAGMCHDGDQGDV